MKRPLFTIFAVCLAVFTAHAWSPWLMQAYPAFRDWCLTDWLWVVALGAWVGVRFGRRVPAYGRGCFGRE